MFGADSADLPDFVCDYDDYFYGSQCDVDSSDYSDYDEPDDLVHDPQNYGEKCVTQSYGKSDISAICDISEISEKAISGVPGVPDICDICVPGVPGVPDIPHGPENCRAKCVTWRYNGGPDDRTSDSCHSDMCTSPPELGVCGDSQFVCMDAPGSDDAGVGNRSFSEMPDHLCQ